MITPICSIIVIINNKKIYEDFLENIKNQINVEYEIISIDNCSNEYNSARIAYNEAVLRAKGRYIIFMHPDIRFLKKDVLITFVNYLSNLRSFGVVGIAGSPSYRIDGKRIILTNIRHGKHKKVVGTNINAVTEVQTVDECFFAVEKRFFEQMPFSYKKGWHLYAVEYCLKSNDVGRKNYVVPADIWHLSDGKSLDYKYVMQIRKLIKEYCKKTMYINTTVKGWKTNGFSSNCYVIYYIIKQWIKIKLKR